MRDGLVTGPCGTASNGNDSDQHMIDTLKLSKRLQEADLSGESVSRMLGELFGQNVTPITVSLLAALINPRDCERDPSNAISVALNLLTVAKDRLARAPEQIKGFEQAAEAQEQATSKITFSPEQRQTLTAQEVADRLGLNVYTVYKWARTRRIPCIRFKRQYRFKLSDIERWEQRHTVGKF